MKSEKFANQEELPQKNVLHSPVVESFSDTAAAKEAWPEDIATNREFLEQIEERQELNQSLNDVFDRLPRPDMDIETAIAQGHITEEQAEKLYNSLSNLLESGQSYERIALYLPFELLPNKKWPAAGENLQQALSRFQESYMQTWQGLLRIHDVRANFVDGDVLETNKRKEDLPRVVKAAHFIPKLVEKGLMNSKDAIKLIEKSEDEVLRQSIADSLPVLADMGLLSEKDIQGMKKSADQLVKSMARIIESSKKEAAETKTTGEKESATFSAVKEKLQEEFSQIDSDDYGDATKNRKKWLIQKKKQEAVEFAGDNIGKAIIGQNFDAGETANFLGQDSAPENQQSLIEGIRKAVESVALTDSAKAQELYLQYKDALLAVWQNNDEKSQEVLAKTFRRFAQLGVVGEGQLTELNITVPKLAGPFSENLQLMAEESSELQAMIREADMDPELSKYIYPAGLMFGSKLKGYGEKKSDRDIAVFIKPGTPFDKRPELQAQLKKVFARENAGEEIIEFWLQEKDGALFIKDFQKDDVELGESSWTHVLFGSTWEGDEKTLQELRQKLLAPYLFETDKKIQKHPARNVYLEEMERDALQYRLMHKGYEKFYPPYGGIHTEHSDEIDGESMFWDSGYRQLATKLYASRVFLPELSSPEK